MSSRVDVPSSGIMNLTTDGAPHSFLARTLCLRSDSKTQPVVADGVVAPLLLGEPNTSLQPFRSTVAAVSVAGVDQPLGRLVVQVEPLRLHVRAGVAPDVGPFVPV